MGRDPDMAAPRSERERDAREFKSPSLPNREKKSGGDVTSLEKCLQKLYVTLRYVPPQGSFLTPGPGRPVDCKKVKFTKDPEIIIFAGRPETLSTRRPDEVIGIDFHCAIASTEGAGKIILLLQVSSYIEW